MKIVFDQKGTFQSYYAATAWCTANGYSYGSMCSPSPIGLLKGDFNIAKWKNLTKAEIKQLDGTITGDFREGPLTINIK